MNDTKKQAHRSLTLANDNVWYWLATLHGEQTGSAIDDELAESNRAAWLHWFAPSNNSKLYAALKEKGVSDMELQSFSREERESLLKSRAMRLGLTDPLPQPAPGTIANFSCTHFEDNVSFLGFLFVNGATFHRATFSKDADFFLATFSEFATFHDATFSGFTGFNRATFVELVNFNNATFFEDTHFIGAKFCDYADFRKAKFSKATNFGDAKFDASTVFADATFVTGVPDFRGATLHEATEWHGANWPESEDGGDYQNQVYAYERLKQEMDRLKKHEDEQFFFRKEFRARRGLANPWSGAWLLNCSYELLSDYGHSVAKPLWGLLWVFAIGIPIFWSPLCPPSVLAGTSTTIWHAAAISFSNTLSIFPGAAQIMLDKSTVSFSGGFRLFAVAQYIFGALLLFLLGLALRNRFRMK